MIFDFFVVFICKQICKAFCNDFLKPSRYDVKLNSFCLLAADETLYQKAYINHTMKYKSAQSSKLFNNSKEIFNCIML